MWISELFTSIQGEGRYTGVRSTFVRTSGCNLRCRFCDTPETSWHPAGTRMSWEQVADEVSQTDVEHVVLTGGEPLLQPDVVPLTARLAERGHVVTIETAGTVDRPVTAHLMSVSPKLASSTPDDSRHRTMHDGRRIAVDVLSRFLRDYDCQLKFVVVSPTDLPEIESLLGRLPDADASSVWLMPEGVEPEILHERTAWIEHEAEARGWNVSPRLHIERFGNTRGT